MLIDGVHIPLAVPFDREGRSYLRKLESNVLRYSLTPAAGLVALTSGCEGHAVTEDEVREALQAIGRSAAAEKVLVACIARETVRQSLAVAEHAAIAGFDAALLPAPTGWQRLSPVELGLYFRAVADRSPLPVVLGSDRRPGLELPVDLVGELAGHANIIGMYDEALTAERYRALCEVTSAVRREVTVTTVFAPVTTRMKTADQVDTAVFVTAESLAGGTAIAVPPARAALKTRRKTVGFQLMAAGGVRGTVGLLEAGVQGVMPMLATCAPQVCHEVFAAFKDGDLALASEKENRLLEADVLMESLGIAGIKYGCDLNGYYGGPPRLPRLSLDASARGEVERVMASLKN